MANSKEATVYATLENAELGIKDIDTIEKMLKNPNLELVSHDVPKKPKGGEIYVYQLSSLKHPDDIKCDQYTWKQTSTVRVPEDDPVAVRRYYAIMINRQRSLEFRRHIIHLEGDCDYAMVQYLGNENVYQGHIHGNSKSRKREYIRESASVKAQILQTGDQKTPSVVYKEIVGKSGDESVIHIPRNPMKVENVQRQFRDKTRISHDALYSVRELCYHLPQFIHRFDIAPNIVLHLLFIPLFDALHDSLSFAGPTNPMYLCYDTTFELGDFYVSVISFRHCYFEGSPIIPIGFLIHDRKLQRDHDLFIEEFLLRVNKNRIKRPVALVTDREFDFQRLLPEKMFHVYCLNHLKRNVKEFLKYRVGVRKDSEVTAYVDSVHSLLSSVSEADYRVRKDVEMRWWSRAFVEYYEEKLEPAVKERSGRWLLEDLGIYTPNSGITTNCAESLNSVLKLTFGGKEQAIDKAVLALFDICRFTANEVKRGLHGIGKFDLRRCLTPLPVEDLPKLPKTLSAEEIAKRLNHVEVSEDDVQEGSATTKASHENSSKVPDGANPSTVPANTPRCMAQAVLDENRITFVPEQRAFVVEGSDQKIYAVKLFPKQTCQCPAVKTCYHIQAALMYLGADITPSKPVKINMSLLHKKGNIKAGQKRSGRKKPGRFDYDIVGAPDSKEAEDGVVVKCVQPVEEHYTEQNNSEETTQSEALGKEEIPHVAATKASSSVLPNKLNTSGSTIVHCGDAVMTATSLQPKLLAWGSSNGSMSNTCPIDNLLSLCYIAYADSPECAAKVQQGTTSAESNLNLAINLIASENFEAAKRCWVEYLEFAGVITSKNGIYNLWGSECVYFVERFFDVFSISGDDCCEHQDTCPKPIRRYQFHLLCADKQPLQMSIEAAVSAHQVPCTQRMAPTTENRPNTKRIVDQEFDQDGNMREVKVTQCSGMRNVYDLSFENENVWLYPINLHEYQWTVKEAMALPETIDVLSKTFYLRGFTAKVREDHFVSYIWRNGKYSYYDALHGGIITDKLPRHSSEVADFALYTV